jgi:hypothetical protein
MAIKTGHTELHFPDGRIVVTETWDSAPSTVETRFPDGAGGFRTYPAEIYPPAPEPAH